MEIFGDAVFERKKQPKQNQIEPPPNRTFRRAISVSKNSSVLASGSRSSKLAKRLNALVEYFGCTLLEMPRGTAHPAHPCISSDNQHCCFAITLYFGTGPIRSLLHYKLSQHFQYRTPPAMGLRC